MDLIESLKVLEGINFELTSAKKIQDDVYDIMVALGYKTQKEVWIENRGDGRSGRIDIVGEKDGVVIAVEIDRFSPRLKSVYKLQNYPAQFRLAIQRCPFHTNLV